MNNITQLIDRILGNRILLHILFWISLILLFMMVLSLGFGVPMLAVLFLMVLFLPVRIGATYFLIYYQIPKYLYTKRYLRFAGSLLLSIIVFCGLAHIIEDYVIAKIATGYSDHEHTFWEGIINDPIDYIWYSKTEIYPIVFFVTALKFIKQRFEENTQLTILEREKATAEIKLIKAQVNPRILSKALKQLHVLTKEESENAPEVVIKLSEILDYMLYQCNSQKVLLSKEIELIENYLALEKIRYGDQLNLKFFHHLDTDLAEISPLLLLPIIESAFPVDKASVPTKATVDIILRAEKNQLHFQVVSTLIEREHGNELNFKKQLDLLYPDQYQLETSFDKQYFVDLKLTL